MNNITRRSFLSLAAAAPLAALAPWQPPPLSHSAAIASMFNGLHAGFDAAGGMSRSWLVVWNEKTIEGIFPAEATGRFVRASYTGDGERERIIGFEHSDDGREWSDVK